MNEAEMLDAIVKHTEYIKRNGLSFEGYEIIQTKWCGRILLELQQNSVMRFGEIKKAMPEISNVVLTAALRKLVEKKLVVREQFNEIPPHVEYSLTKKGRGMLPVTYELIRWEEKYLVRTDAQNAK